MTIGDAIAFCGVLAFYAFYLWLSQMAATGRGIHWPSFWQGFREAWGSKYAVAIVSLTAAFLIWWSVR